MAFPMAQGGMWPESTEVQFELCWSRQVLMVGVKAMSMTAPAGSASTCSA